MRRWTMVAVATLMLAGCNKAAHETDDAGDAGRNSGVANPFENGASGSGNGASAAALPTPGGVAGGVAGTAGPPPLAPGQWEVTFSQMSAKGINFTPDEAGGAVDSFGDIPLTASGPQRLKLCLSADDAARIAPKMLSGGLDNCQWQKISAPTGSINGTLICGQPTDRDVTYMTMTGSMLPNLVGTRISAIVGDPKGKHVAIDAMLQGQRVGDCPASGAP